MHDQTSLVAFAALAGPGATFYLPDLNAEPVNTVAHSRRLGTVATGDGGCSSEQSFGFFVPAVPGLDLQRTFTPPFSVKRAWVGLKSADR